MSKMKQFLFLFLLPLVALSPLSANALSQQEAQRKINNINGQIKNLNKVLADNQNKERSLENEIAIIDAQIQEVQLQIESSEYQIGLLKEKIAEINKQIAVTEADLAVQHKVMKEYLSTMYMDGQISMAELLMKSDSFSDFVDQSEYLSSMQQKVQETANKIIELKNQLDSKKAALVEEKHKVEELKASQVARRSAIRSQQNYKNQLLAQARSKSSALNQKIGDLFSQKAALSAAFGENLYLGGSGYPYGNPPASSRIDTPDAYGYLIGECTSYAAWKRSALGRPVPRNLGNANTWASIANGSTPSVGAVMVFPNLGAYGHVAIVERVNSNGTVYISEYNWTPYRYSERTVNPYNYGAVFIR